MFKLDKNTNKFLEEAELAYRTSHNAGQTTITAEIIDKRAKGQPVVAKATADGEKAAVEAALKKFNPADRPKTAAQLHQENQELKQQLARLEAEREGKPAATVRPQDSRNIGTVNGSAANSTGVDDQHNGDGGGGETPMSSEEIVQALKARHIAVPEGDKRTNAWRDAAFKLLEEHDAE